jgi:hypothetical protein
MIAQIQVGQAAFVKEFHDFRANADSTFLPTRVYAADTEKYEEVHKSMRSETGAVSARVVKLEKAMAWTLALLIGTPISAMIYLGISRAA